MNPNTNIYREAQLAPPPFGYQLPPPPPPPFCSYYHQYQAPAAATCFSTYYSQPTNVHNYHYSYYPDSTSTIAAPVVDGDDNLISLQLSNLDLNNNNTSSSRRRRRSTNRSISSSEFDESKFAVEIRTSVMIRNIPNKFSRGMLIEMLDQHCARENCKAAMEGSPLSEYDFVYLPMDFKNKCNLGYAFVNWTTPLAGWRLYWEMHNCKWVVFGSKKITHICYARIQGKEAMVDNFSQARFYCNDEEYLPAVFSPPRNGTSSLTPPAPLGILHCTAHHIATTEVNPCP